MRACKHTSLQACRRKNMPGRVRACKLASVHAHVPFHFCTNQSSLFSILTYLNLLASLYALFCDYILEWIWAIFLNISKVAYKEIQKSKHCPSLCCFHLLSVACYFYVVITRYRRVVIE